MGARRKPPPISARAPTPGQTHQPTAQTRAKVKLWAEVGTQRHVIAHELGISEGVLRKAYFYELEEADSRGVANVAATLYAKALAGDVSAMQFFLKSRGKAQGWQDKADMPTISITADLDLVRGITSALTAMKTAHPSTSERVLDGVPAVPASRMVVEQDSIVSADAIAEGAELL